MQHLCSALFLCLLAVLPGTPGTMEIPAYDPLAAPVPFSAEPLRLTVNDTKRHREIPLRIFLPPADGDTARPAPVLLFSHGLGGSRDNNTFLGAHWAARGYAVVFIQHHGSDESVWKNKRPLAARAAMQKAASLENFRLRADDIPAVLDQLTAWDTTPAHALSGKLDLEKIGMSGHSFGALTTQAVSGQRFPGGVVFWTEPRIKAAVAFSPSKARAGDTARAFGTVKIPWLLMTGTHDTSPIGDITVADRLAVFPALPPGGKYELVLDGADHMAFSDATTRPAARDPRHHRAILAISTAFWDAHLKNDTAARQWLDGDAPKKILHKEDRWQKK